MKRILTIFIAILMLYAYSGISAANAEKSLGFQGQLYSNNSPLTSSVNATFTFYDASTGGNITGSQIAKTVTVNNGYFGTQFTESDTTGVDFNQQLYLEVSINGTTLSPRTTINPTVSSLKTFGTFSYTSAPTVGPAGSLYFNTTDGALYTSDGTSWTTASSSWLTNGTTTYYTAGNVGIGTSTPVDSLHIVGGRLRIENSGNAEMILKSTSSTTATVGFRNSADSTRGLVSYNFALEQMSFRVNGISDRLVISSTGLVGIGTSTPIARLSVKGSGSGILAQFSDSSDVSRFTILETGNVGIGSSTPSAKLTIAGDIRIDDTISRGLKLMRSGIAIGDITTSNSRLTMQDRAGAGVEFTSSSSVSLMMLTGAGNLGIGTTTAIAPLHISKPTAWQLIESTGSNADAVSRYKVLSSQRFWQMGMEGSISGGTVGALDNFGLLYSSDGTSESPVIVFSPNGNTAIGTTSPQFRLDVQDLNNAAVAQFTSDYTGGDGKKYGSIIIGKSSATSQGAQFGYVYDPASALDSFAHITPFGTPEGEVFAITRRSKVGVGTTTPEAKFSISANNSDTNALLFTVASSTSATSSINVFTVTNAGVVMVNKSKTANPVMSGNSNQLGIQQFGFPGQQNTITMYANGGANNVLAGYSTHGTADVPTATLADTFLLRLAGGGHTGSTYTSKAEISMMASENWSSTSTGAHIAFYTTATSSTSRTEKMRLVGNGFLGLGTTTPTAQLTTTGTVRFASLTGAGANLVVDSLGNVTVSSDERLKDIQGDFVTSLDKIKGLTPITYKWKPETGYDASSTYAGFSAQNVQANIPEAVSTDSKGFLTLADRPILAALVNAVKEIGAWFVDGKFKIQNDVCVDDFCMTKDEFKAMMMNAKNGGNTPTHINIVTPSPVVSAPVSTSAEEVNEPASTVENITQSEPIVETQADVPTE